VLGCDVVLLCLSCVVYCVCLFVFVFVFCCVVMCCVVFYWLCSVVM
jgi:hypothetical protein